MWAPPGTTQVIGNQGSEREIDGESTYNEDTAHLTKVKTHPNKRYARGEVINLGL